MEGLKISLLFLVTCYIYTGSEAKKEDIDDSLVKYEKQLCLYYDTYEEIKSYECGTLNLKEVNKLIKDGDKKIQYKSTDKNVRIIIGKVHSGKMLFGNLIGRLPTNKIPEADIDIYPRYVGNDTTTTGVVYEAANLNATTINNHVAGIYLMNKILEPAKEISLILMKKRLDIWAVWKYFKKIIMFNPEVKISDLKNSTSFVTSDLNLNDLYTEPSGDPNNPKIFFGDKGFILIKEENFNDGDQEAYDDYQRYIKIFFNNLQLVSNVKLPLFNGFDCLNKTLSEKVLKVLSEAASKMTKEYTKILIGDMSKADKLKKFEKALKCIKKIESALKNGKEENTLKESINKIAFITDKGKTQDVVDNSKFLFLLDQDIGITSGLKCLIEFLQRATDGLK